MSQQTGPSHRHSERARDIGNFISYYKTLRGTKPSQPLILRLP